MPVQIHGKDYLTVAERVATFRDEHPDWTIETQLIFQDEDKVVMKALIYVAPDFNNIAPGDPQSAEWHLGLLLSTGYAEEKRDASTINRTSALENAETSAVGRALAFLGLAGTEIASADDVAQAVKQQKNDELVEYNALVRDYFYAIAEAKNYLEPKWGENENQHHVTDARAVLKELGDDVYRALWKAPTKGGIFTTEERSLLKEKPEDAL